MRRSKRRRVKKRKKRKREREEGEKREEGDRAERRNGDRSKHRLRGLGLSKRRRRQERARESGWRGRDGEREGGVPKSSGFPLFRSCHLSTFDVLNDSSGILGLFVHRFSPLVLASKPLNPLPGFS